MHIKLLVICLFISVYASAQRYMDERLYAGISLGSVTRTIASQAKDYDGDNIISFNVNLRHRFTNSFAIGAEYFLFKSNHKQTGLVSSSANRFTFNLLKTTPYAKWLFIEYGAAFSYYNAEFIRHYSLTDGFGNTYYYSNDKLPLSSALFGFIYSINFQVKRFTLRAETNLGVVSTPKNFEDIAPPGIGISRNGRIYAIPDIKLSYSLFHNRATTTYNQVPDRIKQQETPRNDLRGVLKFFFKE